MCRIWQVLPDYEQGVHYIGIAIAIAAFPSAAILAGIVIRYIIQVLKAIDYKKLWKEIVGDRSNRSIIKTIGMTIIQLALAVLIGTALLTAVYILPTERINYNVKSSAYTVEKEGADPVLYEWALSRLDNYTGSIMMLEAACDPVSSPIKDAMNAPRGYNANRRPDESLVAHYVNGVPFDGIMTYPRYWHGYLIFQKPLLEFMDYEAMRILNGIVQFGLVLLICGLLLKTGNKSAGIAYFIAYLMLMPIALAKSFQYSSCFYVFNLGCLPLLLLREERRRDCMYSIFLFCGILTAFFDFLTYPISTFGVPMLLWLLLAGGKSVESKLGAIIKNGLFWCIGFASDRRQLTCDLDDQGRCDRNIH